MSDVMTERIAKLLAKAESTTPEEAEALTAKAEELMLKYGIERATAEAASQARGERSTEKIVTKSVPVAGAATYRRPLASLGGEVARGLDTVRMYRSHSYDTVYYVGYESDVDAAITLYQSLMLQAITAMRSWWRSDGKHAWYWDDSEKPKARKEFIYGFAAGVRERLEQSRAKVYASDVVTGSSTDLVLRSHKSEVDQAYAKLRLSKGRSRRSYGSANANGAGVNAGRNANTGGSAVGSGSRALTH